MEQEDNRPISNIGQEKKNRLASPSWLSISSGPFWTELDSI